MKIENRDLIDRRPPGEYNERLLKTIMRSITLMESDIITGITSSDQLERKMHLKGKVVKTTRAGAIVDIGVEKPALLHVSQIITEKDEPLLKVEETLKENDEV